MIVRPEGYILANNHVVREAADIKVLLGDKREFAAQIIGTGQKTGIAC